jgi:histidinol-phosphate aminotransferase
MHSLVCRGTGTSYERRDRGDDFSIEVGDALNAVRDVQPDVVFVCSPNNPTGTAVAHATIAKIADAAAGIVIMGEAYGERSTQPSAVQLLSAFPNLVVVRTMSKAFALAGARVGYAVASPEVVAALQLVRLPYHLSSITQATALAALDHVDELLAYVDVLKDQRDRMSMELQAMGLTVLPSDANFVWFGGFDDAHSAWQALVDQGVLVRDLNIPGYLRVTAGTPEQTDAFLTAVRQILKENVA